MSTNNDPFTIDLSNTYSYDSMNLSGPTPTITISSIDNTSAGLHWGMNGTSADWITATSPNLKGASLSVKGDADFEGDVTIKGKSIADTLTKLEERLAILRPNEELEAKWEKLRDLRKQYMELEADIIEKEKIWKILKD